MTMIIVTHQMGFAREAVDQVVFMENGALMAEAPPETFFSSCMENHRFHQAHPLKGSAMTERST